MGSDFDKRRRDDSDADVNDAACVHIIKVGSVSKGSVQEGRILCWKSISYPTDRGGCRERCRDSLDSC